MKFQNKLHVVKYFLNIIILYIMVERQIYLARRTVIEMLSDRGFNVSNIIKTYPYTQFNNMLKYFDNYSGVIDITAEKNEKSIYVKFISHINDKKNKYEGITKRSVKSVSKELTELKKFIDSKYMTDEIMYVICYGDHIHDKHKEEEQKYNNLQIFHISNLTFNITKHILVPKHEKLEQNEIDILLNNIMIDSIYQLPYINPNDPMAKYLNMKEGDICKVTRNSVDAFIHICYRVCSDEDNNKKTFINRSKNSQVTSGLLELDKIDDYDDEEMESIIRNDSQSVTLDNDSKLIDNDSKSIDTCRQGIQFTPHWKHRNVSTDIPYALSDSELDISLKNRFIQNSKKMELHEENILYKGTPVDKFIDKVITKDDGGYGKWNINSKLNTLAYMFQKFRSGYYLQIRDGKLNLFVPFYNVEFKNNWYHLITPTDIIGLNDISEQWVATNCLLKLTYKPLEDKYNLDTFREVENMFKRLCENRGENLSDIDLFINVKDFPILRKDKTEPYNHIYGKGTPLENTETNPWGSPDFSYYPILSYNSNDEFLDIPIPTNHEWQAITQEVYPSRCQKQYINDFSPIPWDNKIPTAVFRGSATGCSLNIDRNPRLKVAQLDKEWRGVNHPNKGLLNAGITKFPNHLVTEEGDSNVYNSRDSELPNKKQINYGNKTLKELISCGNWKANNRGTNGDNYINFMSMQEQSKYKYILNIEGNSAAYRLSYLLSLGCVILNVKCENKLWWEKLWKPYNFDRSQSKNPEPSEIGEYIEIKNDLRNLDNIIRWCKENDDICKQLAKNAKAFYHKYLTQGGVFDYLETIISKISNNEEDKVYKTNIIVPFRDIPKEQKKTDTQDRSKHLKQFKSHMITFIPKLVSYLKEKGIESEFDITIIEQSQDGRMFNRGALLNTAYHLTMNEDGNPKYDSYIFHDVDLLPTDGTDGTPDMIPAYAGPYQRGDIAHIASEWDRYKNPGKYLGGVTLFGSYVFRLINGFPNNYWGWGGEDDELRRRRERQTNLIDCPAPPVDPIKLVGKQNGLVDLEEISKITNKKDILKSQGNFNPVRYEGKDQHNDTWESNGLKQFNIDDSSKTIFHIENSETIDVQTTTRDLSINIKTLTVVLNYNQMKPFEKDTSL